MHSCFLPNIKLHVPVPLDFWLLIFITYMKVLFINSVYNQEAFFFICYYSLSFTYYLYSHSFLGHFVNKNVVHSAWKLQATELTWVTIKNRLRHRSSSHSFQRFISSQMWPNVVMSEQRNTIAQRDSTLKNDLFRFLSSSRYCYEWL